jgi:hypothetical protein
MNLKESFGALGAVERRLKNDGGVLYELVPAPHSDDSFQDKSEGLEDCIQPNFLRYDLQENPSNFQLHQKALRGIVVALATFVAVGVFGSLFLSSASYWITA